MFLDIYVKVIILNFIIPVHIKAFLYQDLSILKSYLINCLAKRKILPTFSFD